MSVLTRSTMIVTAAALGWIVGLIVGGNDLVHSPAYRYLAAALLAIGLIGSTRSINIKELRSHLRPVLVAVTIGVVVKAAIITAVVYAFFHNPAFLVLGVVVAQIDPLSVAAMTHQKAVSARSRAILSTWASFDDPVTVLLTIYVSAWALNLSGPGPSSFGTAVGDGPVDFLVGLALNLLFAAAALVVWWPIAAVRRRLRARHATVPIRILNAVAVALLLALMAVATWRFLMLGLAVAGLFFRPVLGRLARRGTRSAYLVAVFVLGLLLVHGVHLAAGVVLGLAAVVAQMIVSVPISRGLPRRDRYYLAFGQQNGVTAVILALLLERDFPGTVGVVAIGILTINVAHLVFNTALDRWQPAPRPDQERPDQERPDQERPDQERSDQERSDQERPDQERPDQVAPAPQHRAERTHGAVLRVSQSA